MKPPPADVISADPRTFSSRMAGVTRLASRLARVMARPVSFRLAWLAATAVLVAAALAGAVATAVHYRGETAALHWYQRTVSSRTVVLPPSYAGLKGAVTVLAVPYPGGRERIAVSGHISGGTPRTGYALVGADCADSGGYGRWAAGRTDAHGDADLSGRAWTISRRDQYWLFLSPSSRLSFQGLLGRGLLGRFTAAGAFSASPAGAAACAAS
jgi:hypothetical protein